MTPEQAHAQLSRAFDRGLMDPVSRVAWRALDEALSGGAALPEPWARLTVVRAAERAGKNSPSTWLSLIRQGYAPPPDGHDESGRAFWHPATIDRFVSGEWTPPPRPPRDPDQPPPTAGPGSDRDSWAQWATAHGVTVLKRMRRDTIREECRKAGLIT